MNASVVMRRLILMTGLWAACVLPAQAGAELDDPLSALRAHYRQVDASLAMATDARSLLARATLRRALLLQRALADGPPQAIAPTANVAAIARRAIDAADADSHVLVTLASSTEYGLLRTDRQRAVERLRMLDPGNVMAAFVELELLGDGASDDDIDDLLASAATHAANASLHSIDTVLLLTDALGSVPLPPALLTPLDAAAGDAKPLARDEQARLVIAGGVAMALALPSLGSIGAACSPEQASGWSDRRHDACLRIVKLLAERADTMLLRRVGVSLWHRLVAGTPAAPEAVAVKRALLWQQAAVAELDSELGVSAAIERNGRAWRSTSGEIAALLKRLDEAGVSRLPPDGWAPDNLAQLQP